MPHTQLGIPTRAAAAAGLAAFAAYTLLAPPDDGLFTFFNTWVYDGLMVLACVIAGSHAYLVERERAAWTVITAAMACWTFGEVWYAVFKPETYPSMADARVHRLLPAAVRRHRPPAPLACAHDRRHALARRSDRRARRGRVRRGVIFELVADVTQGSTSVVVTNLAYPLGDVLLLSAVFGVFSLTGWQARRALAAPRARRPLDGAGRLRLPLPVGGGHVRRGHVDRHPLAHGAPPDRGVGLGRRPHARRSRASKGARSSPFRPCARSWRPGSSSTTTSCA